MDRSILAAVTGALIVSTLACGGGIVKGYTHRAARTKHSDTMNCPFKDVKTEVVEVLPSPPGIDYHARVRATGCGNSREYLCSHDDDGGASYHCADPK